MLEKTPDTKERARVLGRERVLKAGGGGQRTEDRRRLELEMAFPRFTTRDPFEFPSSAFLDSRPSFVPSFRLREGVRIHATRRLPFDYVRTCSKPGGGDDHVRPTA